MMLYILVALAIAFPSVHSFGEVSSINSRDLQEHVLLHRALPSKSSRSTSPMQRAQNLPSHDQPAQKNRIGSVIIPSGGRPQAKVKADVVGPAQVESWKDEQHEEIHNINRGQRWRGATRDDVAANMVITTHEGNPSGRVNFSVRSHHNAYSVVHTSTGTGKIQRVHPHLQPAEQVPPGDTLIQESTGNNQKQKIRGSLQGQGSVLAVGKNLAHPSDD